MWFGDFYNIKVPILWGQFAKGCRYDQQRLIKVAEGCSSLAGTTKLCHSPKVEDKVENKFVTSLNQNF